MIINNNTALNTLDLNRSLPQLSQALYQAGSLLDNLEKLLPEQARFYSGVQSKNTVDGPTWLATSGNPPLTKDSTLNNLEPKLALYFSQARANENISPATLGGLTYGSNSKLQLFTDPKRPHINGILENSNLATILELKKSGLANMLNPEWRELVISAFNQNGGLGDSESGFLAFSKEKGFVRLRNTGLTPEQNRKFAEMSLFGGFPIEDLPSRKNDIVFDSPEANKAIEDVIQRYDTGLQDFLADPSKGIKVKDGRRRFELKFLPEYGRAVSYNYKKSGGIKGFAQKMMPYITPIADIVSYALPGIGSVIAQGVKIGMGIIATGKAKFSQVLNFASNFIPGGSSLGNFLNKFKGAVGVLK